MGGMRRVGRGAGGRDGLKDDDIEKKKQKQS